MEVVYSLLLALLFTLFLLASEWAIWDAGSEEEDEEGDWPGGTPALVPDLIQ